MGASHPPAGTEPAVAAPPSRQGRGQALTPAVKVYVIALMAVVGAVLPAGIADATAAPLEALVWIGFVAAANLLTIPMLPKLDLDASLGAPVMVASAVLLSPPLALFVNLLGFTNARELRRDTSLWLVVFNRAQSALSAGAAAVAGLSVAQLLPLARESAPTILIETTVAVVVFNVVNATAIAVMLWLRGRLGLAEAARDAAAPFPRFAVDFGLVALLALLIVIAYQQVGPAAVLLLALPLWLGFNALSSARESADRALELAARVRELETLNALGTQLLNARRAGQVEGIGAEALRTVLEVDDVVVSLEGAVPEGLAVVKVPGAEPGAVGVPAALPERSQAVVEAIAGLLGMAVQRLTLEQELADVQRARAALSGRILEEGTRERSRIALQIHDDVLPYLAGAEIQADNVRSALQAGNAAQADALARATHDAVHGGIGRLREVLDALTGQIVVPGGLRPALVSALDDLRLKAGVEGVLDAPDPLPELPLAVEILAVETARGCLTNVARHAHASAVRVALAVEEAALRLVIADDGRGFHPDAPRQGHHGLALMRQRVELARGRFAVHSERGVGTTIQVEVPL